MLIALTGPKQSGKTVIADYIAEKYGYSRLNFKDALIEEVKERLTRTLWLIADENNLTIDELFTKKPYLPIIRLLLQEYGTDVRRKDDEGYWVYKWLRKFSASNLNVVVDDCRFLNEADMISRLGGEIIRVVRPSLAPEDSHQSETEQQNILTDNIIINDGSTEDLKKKVDKLMV